MKEKSWSWRSSGPTPGLSECQGLLTRELGNLDQTAPKESFLDKIPVFHAGDTSTNLIKGNPWPSHRDALFPALLSFLLTRLRMRWAHDSFKAVAYSCLFSWLWRSHKVKLFNGKEMINSLNLYFWNTNSKYLSTSTLQQDQELKLKTLIW